MPEDTYFFVGTYTEKIFFSTGAVLEGKGEGICLYRLNAENGTLELLSKTGGTVNPSYLALRPGKRFLYAVNELKNPGERIPGEVSAFSVDPETGRLAFLNKKPSGGTDPCHLCVNGEGSHVFVANYGSGSVAVFPIGKDGSLGDPPDVVRHAGSSVDPVRQTGPHAHSVTLDPAGRYAVAADLGTDRLMVYRFDAGRGRLLPGDPPYAEAAPGAGPRHCAFHPSGNHLFVVNELASTLTACSYDGERGRLRPLQSVPTVPGGAGAGNTAAGIQVSPSGEFVYASNRGDDSIVQYRFDSGAERLSFAGIESCGGRTPRSITIDPSGAFLLACNQDSGTIVTFRIDSRTGGLSKTAVTEVPTPVCAAPVY